jgi:threonine/homoserine/homoserine lactone efflux protein
VIWQAFGALLPLTVAIAVSSVPIMATILILLSPRRNITALPFLAGWMIGMALVITLAAIGTAALPQVRRREADLVTAVIEILLGLAMVTLAGISWWRRAGQSPEESDEPAAKAGLPRWLRAIGSFGPLTSFGVAVLLNFRPKGLVIGIAAGVVLHNSHLSWPKNAIMIAVYTALGASTVGVPIIATLIAPARLEPRLRSARDWLSDNGALVTSLMLFVIGIVVLGAGLTNL